MSGNEVEKLKLLGSKLAVLCPEMAGLQKKYRIWYEPESIVYKEQVDEIILFVYEQILPLCNAGNNRITHLVARQISYMLYVVGFTQDEIYRILQKERYKKK